MKCSKCGFENIDSANYCINCGARMDGKIVCPKCGELLSPDTMLCPKCGRKIPHISSEANTNSSSQERLRKIFALIINVAIIVALAISLILVWGKYVSQVNSSNAHFGFAHYYLFLSWNDMMNLYNTVKDTFFRFGLVSQTIVQFIAILANIVITYVFAIKGIVISAKSLKNKEGNIDSLFNIVMVLVSNAIAFGIIFSSSYSFTSNAKYSDGGFISNLIGILTAVLIASIVFYNIIVSKKSEIMALIERLLFATTLLFIIFALCSATLPIASINGTDYGSMGLFFELIRSFGEMGTNDKYIAVFVLSIFLVCFKFALYMLCGGFVIYFVTGYYSNKETRMSYKIPCYSIVLVTFIVSSIILGLNIGQIVLLNDLKFISNTWNFGSYVWVSFGLAFTAFGGGVASLVLSRKQNHNALLAEQTTRQ